MQAKGINIHGETLYFDIVDGRLDCHYSGLKSLEVPEGVTQIDCSCNWIKELTIPAGVTELDCTENQLNSLEVPEGVKVLNCSANELTELTIPKSVIYLSCYDNSFNNPNYFTNPHTNRVVIKQGDLFYAGCFNGDRNELLEICLEKGYTDVIEHFNLK